MGISESKTLRRRLGAGVMVAALAVVSGAAVAGPKIVQPKALRAATAAERVYVMVELTREPTAVKYRHELQLGGMGAKAQATAAAQRHLSTVYSEQFAFAHQLASAGLTTAHLMTPKVIHHTYSMPFLGVMAALIVS